MAGEEHEVAFLRAGEVPLEEMIHLGRLAVFVGAKDRDIEIVAGILEVVGIAAEERRLLLGREDEADVGVNLVAVKVVARALVERDDVAAQAGGVEGFLFDRGLGGVARGEHLGGRHVGAHRGVHLGGDVLDRLEHVELEVDALELLGARAGVEAVEQEVLFLGAELEDRVEADVVIRDDEAVGRRERARAAVVEAHGRALDVREPLGARLEAVALLELRERRVVEEPHAVVGARDERGGAEGKEQGDGTQDAGGFHGGGKMVD